MIKEGAFENPKPDAVFALHVFWTGSDTLLVEQAFDATSCNGLVRKVYWTVLVPTPAGIRVEPLDRRRSGHYVWTWDVGSYPWLTTSAMLAAPARID